MPQIIPETILNDNFASSNCETKRTTEFPLKDVDLRYVIPHNSPAQKGTDSINSGRGALKQQLAIDAIQICYRFVSLETLQASRSKSQINPTPQMHTLLIWACLRTSRTLGRTTLEPILEFSGDVLHRSHTSSAGGLSPLGLLTPVVCRSVLATIIPR